MFNEDKLPAWSQYAAQLTERTLLIAHPAQHQGRDRRVEGVVLEGKVLRRRPSGP